jgi:hypothetical protein
LSIILVKAMDSTTPHPNTYRPTSEQRKMVRKLAAVGMPHEHICRVIKDDGARPIDAKTLRKHFREELDEGMLEANALVANALFKFATDPDGGMKAVHAAIFWLKARSNWRETDRLEVTGAEGAPLGANEARRLTDDDLHKLIANGGAHPADPIDVP